MPTFLWCKTHQYDSAITNLFLNTITTDYISHSEIQYGRAISTQQWHQHIAQQFQSELDNAISSQISDQEIAISLDEEKLLGVAMLSYTKAAIYFATLDDLIISSQARGMGIGSQFIDWIEHEMKIKGINHLFLESGIQNQSAHHFFEKKGFTPVSVTMMKKL